MKRVLSFLCAVAMILTMCTFYMGEALSVAAEGEQAPEQSGGTVVNVATYEEFVDAVKAATKGTTIKLTANLYASEWTVKSIEAATVTLTDDTQDATISIEDAETFGTVTNDVTVTNSEFGLTLPNDVNIDGDGHSINGLVVIGNPGKDVYLFNKVDVDSTVENLTIANSVFIVKDRTVVAPLANEVYGKVIDCQTANSVVIASRYTLADDSAICVSGLIYRTYPTGVEENVGTGTTLQDVYDGLSGEYKVTSEALVDGCVNNANILVYNRAAVTGTGTYSKQTYSAGIIGIARGTTVRNCVNAGNITVYAANAFAIGGILAQSNHDGDNGRTVGYMRNVNIYNCANYGDITTNTTEITDKNNVGGIIGYISAYHAPGGQCNIASCYNGGAISRGNAYGLVGAYTGATGNTAERTLADGYVYYARLNGGTALNFIKSSETPNNLNATDKDDKISSVSVQSKGTGSFSLSRIYATADNTYSEGFLDETNVWEILNVASKYLEGARPWKNKGDGTPEIDFDKESTPLTINTVDELKELQAAFTAFENLGSEMEIKATLANDIDLNPGYTFGYDLAKYAGTITEIATGTTYYLGHGANVIDSADTGKFYTTTDGTTFTAVDAPALATWTPFASMASPNGRCHSDKVTLRLDGNGKTISGLYIGENTPYGGFASLVSNVHFSNLTLDGLYYQSTTDFWNTGSGKGTGAFIGTAYTDCTVVDCTSNVTIMTASLGGGQGGIVGWMGSNTNLRQYVLENMPNRISKVIGCVNNGTIATTAASRYVAGVVGWIDQGEVLYNTNTGTVCSAHASNGSNRLAGIAIAYPVFNLTYSTSHTGATGNRTPYQTTIRVIGNSNTGEIKNRVFNYRISILYANNKNLSDGAWRITDDGPLAVLESEFTVENNVGAKTHIDMSTSVMFEAVTTTALKWNDGSYDLDVTVQDNNNAFIASVTKDNVNAAFKTANMEASDNGYRMFIDYDYSNKGVPHAVKIPEGFGYTLSDAGALTEITIGSAEALMFLNDIVNSVTTKTVTVGDVEVADIYDAYAKGVAIADYLTAARNGAPDLNTSLSGVTVKLTADIDLGGAKWLPLGNDKYAYDGSLFPTYGFKGTFDGDGNTISNFTFPRDTYVGFFGTVVEGGTVKDVNFSNVNVSFDKYGAIAAAYVQGTISGVTVDETCSLEATGGYAAAILGFVRGSMTNCTNKASVNVYTYGAGIVSKSYGSSGNVTKCVNYGAVTSTGAGYIAGIIATTQGGTVKQNINRGAIGGDKENSNFTNAAGIVAHLIGANAEAIGNVNYAPVSAYSYAAGIIATVGFQGTTNSLLVKGNVNYGTITRGTYPTGVQLPNGGIVAFVNSVANDAKNERQRAICYNVNVGDYPEAYFTGGIIGIYNENKDTLTANVYGNINVAPGKSTVAGWANGKNTTQPAKFANNYVPNATANATLIGGAKVTENQFKLGHVATVINTLNYTAENFNIDSEDYLWNDTENEKIPSTTTTSFSAYAVPRGFEDNYMVQRIGIDEYPLPKLAAELIYAEQGVEDVEAELAKAAASVAKGEIYQEAVPDILANLGETEQLIGFIDSSAKIHRPGEELTDATYLYPLTIDFYTAFGAAARTKDPTGIRYQTFVNKDSVDLLGKIMGMEDGAIAANFGTIIIPENYTSAYIERGTLDAQTILTDANQEVKIENDVWAPSTNEIAGHYTYFGSLIGIYENHYNLKYSGISYLKVEYEDGTGYITAPWQKENGDFVAGLSYDFDANARHIQQIAFRALAKHEAGKITLSAKVEETLRNYCGDYTEEPAA